MVVVFVGHSQINEQKGIAERIMSALSTYVHEDCTSFYLGAYGDFDWLALRVCQQYREMHRGAKLFFITPYLNDTYLKRREEIVRCVDEVVFPAIESTPPKYAISKRNQWMVNQADLIIAYVKYGWGGAAKALEYARQKGKAILNLAEKD